MAFTVTDLADLIHLLAEHPEWRTELRPLILGDDLPTLPSAIRDLAQAQARTEARVEELAQAQRETQKHLADLSRTVERLAITMDRFAGELQRVGDRLGFVDGRWLEQRFYDRAASYFGPLIRKPRVVELPDIGADELLEAGRLSEEEYVELSRLDVIVAGEARPPGAPGPMLLAVEVSTQIRESDIERARRRARLLARLGTPVTPVVGGERIGPKARRQADAAGVVIRLLAKD